MLGVLYRVDAIKSQFTVVVRSLNGREHDSVSLNCSFQWWNDYTIYTINYYFKKTFKRSLNLFGIFF